MSMVDQNHIYIRCIYVGLARTIFIRCIYVGLARTVYLVISLPKIPHIHIYTMVLTNPACLQYAVFFHYFVVSTAKQN
jgi:hypothetical protein